MRVAISAGHSMDCQGAIGYLNEVDEARRATKALADKLNAAGVETQYYWDDISDDSNENLNRLADWHNDVAFNGTHGTKSDDIAVSFHLNANATTSKCMGCETWYLTQSALAEETATAMASALELPDRGGKYSSGLFILNSTRAKCILLEGCFVDSSCDTQHWNQNFDAMTTALAEAIGNVDLDQPPVEPPVTEPPPEYTEENIVEINSEVLGDVTIYVNDTMMVGHENCEHIVRFKVKLTGDVLLRINGEDYHPFPGPPTEPAEEPLLHVSGKCSWFGGPEDMGVSADEGLAFIYDYDTAPYLFLDQQPPGTTGLARRLDTEHVYYVACRWDYDVTPKAMLAQDIKARVRANGKEFLAWPADWGPHEDTDRVADISHALMRALGIETDDEIEVIYPATEYVA
jgi:hypothetical protein